jgi:hypothetical protein
VKLIIINLFNLNTYLTFIVEHKFKHYLSFDNFLDGDGVDDHESLMQNSPVLFLFNHIDYTR